MKNLNKYIVHVNVNTRKVFIRNVLFNNSVFYFLISLSLIFLNLFNLNNMKTIIFKILKIHRPDTVALIIPLFNCRNSNAFFYNGA